MSRRERRDVAIAGAGPVGCALALALARAGREVVLIERREPARFDPSEDIDLRVFALAPAARNLLSRLGAWDAIVRARACAYRHMRVWRAGDTAEIAFDAELVGESALGWIVEGRLLGDVLWRAVQDEARIETICPGAIESLEPGVDEVRITLDAGRSVRARLLVGADGADSQVRALAGIGVDERDYGERAVVAHLRPGRGHEATAWQRFLDTGPLALLPLADGRVSIVWTLPEAQADQVLSLDPEAFGVAVGEASDRRLGDLRLASSRAAFPLRRRLATRYVHGRVALVGDAAHAVHPLAGQGMNLGLLDVSALAGVVSERPDADPGAASALQRYQRLRQGENALAARGFELLHDAYQANANFWPALRSLGVRAIDASRPLKRQIALAACGYGGEVPALSQRLPLP